MTDSSNGVLRLRRETMSIGMNLEAIVDWSPAWTFRNAFLASRPWINQVFDTASGSIRWDDPSAPLLDIDRLGTVRRLNRWQVDGAEQRQYASTLLFRDSGGTYPAGRYLAEWDGSGRLRFGFDARVLWRRRTASGGSRALLQVEPTQAGIEVRLESTDPNDPIRNIRVWMPDDQGESLAGVRWQPGDPISPFHPLFLRRLEPFGILRFMAMQETNSSDIRHWWQRRDVNAIRQSSGAEGTASEPLANGMSVEYMVELANALDADPWFNMPYRADDSFVRRFATYVRDHLEPGRRVYVEWANEVWNFADGFEASRWAQARARREGLDPDEGIWIVAGREAKRDLDIWAEVFAGQDSHQLVRVAGGWAAVDWVTNRIAEAMDGAFDALAIAPYLTPTDAQRASYDASTTVQQVLADTRANIATSAQWVADHAALAETWSTRLGHPIQLLAYEGGVHLDGRDQPYQNAFYAAGLTPEMGRIYRDYLRAMDRAGLDAYLDFQFTGQPGASPWGDFAKLHGMAEPTDLAHRYNAVAAAARAADPSEGQSGSIPIGFRIDRAGDFSQPCFASWSVEATGLHPSDGLDFSGGRFPAGQFRLAPGEQSRHISIAVAGDRVPEPDETFRVRVELRDGAGRLLGAGHQDGSIRNDDPPSDPRPPRLTSLTLQGATLVLCFSEAVSASDLSAERFSVRIGRSRRIISSVRQGDDSRVLELTLLGSAPGSSEPVRLLYVDLSPADDADGVVQDREGQDMASISAPGVPVGTLNSATSVPALAAGIRSLRLIGSDPISATGNARDNTIRGNRAGNRLHGLGGRDRLIGAGGADVFVIDVLEQGQHDQLIDFSPWEGDRIGLDAGVFSALRPGRLDAAAFAGDGGDISATQRIQYQPGSGELSYDPDGPFGAAPPTVFAAVPIGLVISHSMFSVS